MILVKFSVGIGDILEVTVSVAVRVRVLGLNFVLV